MQLIFFILGILGESIIFIKRKKIDKKVLITSIILYVLVTLFLFLLNRMGFFYDNVWFRSIYMNLFVFFGYMILIVYMNNMLNKQIKFHTKVGNGEKPLIVKLIKNKEKIHTTVCLIYYFGSMITMYGIWFDKYTWG